ncbi:MAG: AI-2E family transporter [Actinomycetota bacterium]|nr:AI-2E family transporter [Actinomycetota bacterium]
MIPPVPPGLERAAAWAWRLLLFLAVGLLALALLWYLKVIVLPLIFALTIAPALTPLAGRLRRRRRLRRFAAGISLLAGLAAIAALVALVTVSVVAEYDELAESVRQAVGDVTDRLEREPFNVSLEQGRDLDASLAAAWRETSTYLVSGVRSGLGFLVALVLAVALLYFILRDGRALWLRVLRRFSLESRARVDRAGERAWEVLGGFVRGIVLIAAIDAVLIGFGLWILGVPLAFALSVLIFLGAFVPFVGATVTGLVAVLVAFADGGVTTAAIALAIVFGVQFLEGNFLQPIIQSRTVDLHPAVILLAVAAGGSLYGIVGAYLAVPVTAVVTAVAIALGEELEAPADPPPGGVAPGAGVAE